MGSFSPKRKGFHSSYFTAEDLPYCLLVLVPLFPPTHTKLRPWVYLRSVYKHDWREARPSSDKQDGFPNWFSQTQERHNNNNNLTSCCCFFFFISVSSYIYCCGSSMKRVCFCNAQSLSLSAGSLPRLKLIKRCILPCRGEKVQSWEQRWHWSLLPNC